jgi:FtsP/CotA-like multicopper oxidase with cupredoxin domain
MFALIFNLVFVLKISFNKKFNVIYFQDGTATTIHWHGLTQKGTPFSDGVPFITQCPIHFGTTFRYAFYARDAGTHLWHSHSGQHKANGVYGPIVVRTSEEKAAKLYDFDLPDFTILASDWMHVYAEQYFPGLTSRLSIFESLLINGHGRFLNVRIQSHFRGMWGSLDIAEKF